MFWSFQFDDPFNNNKKRNIKNTLKRDYNCAGYALETYSWYCPFDESTIIEGDIEDLEKLAIHVLTRDFNLIPISQHNIRNKNYDLNQYNIIAFRFSNDDFHFQKLGKNMKWYEKRGGTSIINSHSYDEVWENWGSYCRQIYFYLQKRKQVIIMRAKCIVLFSDGRTKIFTGFWKYVIHEIYVYCENNRVETVSANWEDIENEYY